VAALDDIDRRSVDEKLQSWRQGDCVLGEHWFLFRTHVAQPLTVAGAAAASEETDSAEAGVVGFMIATQTCDIVRTCGDRPFIEVCPLVEVDDSMLHAIERGRRPSHAYVAGVCGQRLVADLERTMTVEKSVVASWERIAGCPTEEDARRLALALGRKRMRVAYPDDFVRLVAPLVRRMSSKHDKDSEEGEALRGLREIRVRAAPAWNADGVQVTFWFIREEDDRRNKTYGWGHLLDAWLKRVQPRSSIRFVRVDGVVVTLDDMTARDYVESDPLDLDHLSVRGS
jgi:hypothetical protein